MWEAGRLEDEERVEFVTIYLTFITATNTRTALYLSIYLSNFLL